MKTYIRNLKRKVRHLTKRLKKIEGELHRSKDYAKATIEINHLCQACKKDSKECTDKKNHLKEELEEIRKHASEKS